MDTLFLIARDPRWLFSYWDFDWAKYPAASMRYGYAQFFLKISRETGQQETMVEINPEARNWYVPVNHPDTTYVAEIGYFDQEGAWRAVVKSAPAHTPADGLAPESQDVDFATVPAHLSFERLLDLVQERMSEGETLIAALARVAGEGRVEFRGGQAPTWNDDQRRLIATLLGESLVDRIGLGSAEIDQLLRKQLQAKLSSESASGLSLRLMGELGPTTQSLFSAIGASWSAQPFSVKAERGFYMHVNAEIIFYGGTHPDATVTVSGKQIRITPDGSFRYHFTLPDGDFRDPDRRHFARQGGAALRDPQLPARHATRGRSRRHRPAEGARSLDRQEVAAPFFRGALNARVRPTCVYTRAAVRLSS